MNYTHIENTVLWGFIIKILIRVQKNIKMDNKYETKHILSIPPRQMENCSVTLFDKICRVCFSFNEITCIFEQTYEDINLSEILENCITIQVERNDVFPQNICKWCISELIRMYTFKLHYQQSDAILRAALNMQNSKVIQDGVKELKEETDVGEALLDNSENISRNIQDIDNNVFKPDINPNLHCIKNDIKEELNFEISIKQNNLQVIQTECKILKSKKTHSCKYCNISFDSRLKLIEHKKVAKHLLPRNHICQICNKAFKANSRLQRHMRSHTKEKQFHCEICPKKFSFNNNLKRHNMIHTGERPFTCDECGKGFIQLVELTRHKRVHASEKPPRKKYTVNKEKLNYKFECNICHRRLSSKYILKQHLLKHENQQARAFLCNHCGKCFTTHISLKVHINDHTGFKPYHCSVCNKKFSRRAGLKSHMFIHTGEKPYVCKVCLRAFTQHTHLTYHMKTHTGEKPYACSYCGRVFALKGNFTVHMRTHTGERPYRCDICGRGFYDSSNMKKHRRRHTEVKTDSSYQGCQNSGKT